MIDVDHKSGTFTGEFSRSRKYKSGELRRLMVFEVTSTCILKSPSTRARIRTERRTELLEKGETMIWRPGDNCRSDLENSVSDGWKDGWMDGKNHKWVRGGRRPGSAGEK